MSRDSVRHTILFALSVCLFCSVIVSSAAVGLRSWQVANRAADQKVNVLEAAGLIEKGTSVSLQEIDTFFEKIDVKVVDLDTGDYTDEVDAETYSPEKALGDPKRSATIDPAVDVADVKRRENYAVVYLIRNDEGRIDQIVLPIRGYGLWSTLWGFVSLDAASLAAGPEHVFTRGITYFKHKETPGLGGEVDNPSWKARWSNPDDPKLVFDADWNVVLDVAKGSVDAGDVNRRHKVDGLSGATFTSQGVGNMFHYWLGPEAFGAYLKKLQDQLKSKGGHGG
jgi:Na+-transporting NADH:ubiquinone oxidoreductase subunit C